jgi:hypothetical protein
MYLYLCKYERKTFDLKGNTNKQWLICYKTSMFFIFISKAVLLPSLGWKKSLLMVVTEYSAVEEIL